MWKVKIDTGPSGDSVKILGSNNEVIALLKNGGGRKIENAHRIVNAVNRENGPDAP